MDASTPTQDRPICGVEPHEAEQLAAMVADYQTLVVPRSFEYWLESICHSDEADRMLHRFKAMVDVEMAKEDNGGDYWYSRGDVLFRIGWALGAAAARGVR